jgi:hypothetical protein
MVTSEPIVYPVMEDQSSPVPRDATGRPPVHPLTGLMSVLGHGPGLLAKREGLCGIAAGLGDASAQRETVVLTTGAPQSNHCALTVIIACGPVGSAW